MRQLLIFLIVLTSGCEFFKPKGEDPAEAPVAKVLDTYLYPSDLAGLIPASISHDDSIKLTEKYVEDWVKKQLMIDQAQQVMDYNEAEIERKVLDYRYALMVHSFEKRYIDKNLNLAVDSQEVETYYREKADNFLLKQNIVRCLFAQIPKTAPDLNSFRRNFKAFPDGNKEDLMRYASQHAHKSFLEDSTWVIFEDLIHYTPLESIDGKSQFLEKNSYSETSDDQYFYFLNILEYKISDEVSPLEFIRENIETIIVNKRKLALKKELEEKIYEEAERNKLFEIYR